MNRTEIAKIKKVLEEMQTTISKHFKNVEDAIEGMESFKIRHSGRAKPKVGDTVRVFAVRADEHGISLAGDLAIVVKLPDSKNPYAKTITVRIIDEDHDGKEFVVYPQQCVLADADKEGSDEDHDED